MTTSHSLTSLHHWQSELQSCVPDPKLAKSFAWTSSDNGHRRMAIPGDLVGEALRNGQISLYVFVAGMHEVISNVDGLEASR